MCQGDNAAARLCGIDELRAAVRLFAGCNESFNQRYSAEQLLKLYRAYSASAWDIAPDRWTDGQLARAFAGIAPTWRDENTPTYPK